MLAGMGLRLSPEKTLITHIDEGLDFLGWHIQRHRKRGTCKPYVYTYPARKALAAIMAKVKTYGRRQNPNLQLDELLQPLNRILRGSPGAPACCMASPERGGWQGYSAGLLGCGARGW